MVRTVLARGARVWEIKRMSDAGTGQVQTRFDRMAAEWDSNPTRVIMARAVVEAIRTTVVLWQDMDVMDFGAGTGLVTLGLLPDVGSVTAVDTSGAMLRVLADKLKAQQIGNVQTLLCACEATPLPASRFDLIVSSMVLHHIQDVPQTLQRLRPCLRPGGWIALADLDAEDGTFHADSTGVFHHGFERATVCRWLQDAGFSEITACEAHRIVRPAPGGESRQYPVFLVTGRVGNA